METERNFVEIENLNGEIQKVEIISEIKSERDGKVYVMLTNDEEINDEVNVTIGYIYEEDDKMKLELVENEEELNYVFSLIDNVLGEV